jgi:hypothetical protein
MTRWKGFTNTVRMSSGTGDEQNQDPMEGNNVEDGIAENREVKAPRPARFVEKLSTSSTN